jgi:hypothetical protein
VGGGPAPPADAIRNRSAQAVAKSTRALFSKHQAPKCGIIERQGLLKQSKGATCFSVNPNYNILFAPESNMQIAKECPQFLRAHHCEKSGPSQNCWSNACRSIQLKNYDDLFEPGQECVEHYDEDKTNPPCYGVTARVRHIS